MAEIYRRDGKFDEALAVLKKAQAIAEDSFEVPYSIATFTKTWAAMTKRSQILQDLLKRTEKADGAYSVSERNNRSIFLERLGTVYRDQNKTQLAVETFRKMVALGDDSASRGYQQLVETYRDAKQWSQATAVAAEATKKLPKDRGLKLIYAGQQADTGKAEVAISSVKAMLNGTPDDREIWTALAQMYSRLRRWKDAQEAIGKAEQLSTKPEDKELYIVYRRLDLRTSKALRSGRRGLSEGHQWRSAQCYRTELSWIHVGRSWYAAGRSARLHTSRRHARPE